MANITLSSLAKYRFFPIIIAVGIVLTLGLLIFRSTFKDQNSAKRYASPTPSSLKPQTKFEDKDENIRIDFSPGTKTYWVYIDAKSVEEYTQKRKEAVKKLKELNIDPCNYKTTFWPIPGEIKTKFTAQDLKALREITCPK